MTASMIILKDYIRSFLGKAVYPRLVDPGEFDRMMIVAPHPDDDVIGLGGLMALRPEEVISVVYVTNGDRGDPGRGREETAAVRREEAVNATELLGVDGGRLSFLDFPDGRLKDTGAAREALEEAIKNARPHCLFLPFFIDNHPDHISTVKIVAGVIERCRFETGMWCYETWSALVPNRLVDITPVIDDKVRAVGAHQSQIAHIDYREKIKGLNAYRSLTAGRDVEYAEAFFRCSSEDFVTLSRVLT